MADLIVANAELGGSIENGVNVEGRCLWLPTELAESLDKKFLKIIRQVVLGAEKDDATLGDCRKCE